MILHFGTPDGRFHEPCAQCLGTGYTPCWRCEGTGGPNEDALCYACDGDGFRTLWPCETCGGEGELLVPSDTEAEA